MSGPPTAVSVNDEAQMLRVGLSRMLVIGVVVWLAFAAQYGMQGRIQTAKLDVVLAVVTGGCLAIAQRVTSMRALQITWHVGLGFSACGLALAAMWSGHSGAMAIWWIALIPYLAALQVGARAGIAWAVTAVGLIGAVYWNEAHDPLGTEFVAEGLELYGGQVFFVSVLMFLGLASRRSDTAQRANLSRSNERLRALIDSLDVAVVVTDPAWKVVLANKAATKILAVDTASEALGIDYLQHAAAIFSSAGYDEADEIAKMRELHGGRESRGGMEYEFAGGRIVERSHQAVELEGGHQGSLWTLRDITARRQVERLKDDFVSVVSHELRTPLTSIHGALRLVDGGATGELNEKTKAVLRIAVSNSERLRLLIDDLLDMQKIRRGDFTLETTLAPPSDIVAGALEACEGMAQRAGVAIQSQIADTPLVLADRQRATQVLINLCSNAIKFSPDGATISVAIHAREDRVRFEVKDRGPGIPASELERLFLPFEQLDSRSARSKGGSGLGLAIAHAIVEAHGGELGVDSVLGEGSSFWFELPAAP